MRKNRRRSVLATTLIALLLLVTMTACTETGKEEKAGTVDPGPNKTGTEEIKPVTLTFLSAWNGGGAGFPPTFATAFFDLRALAK